MFVLLVAGEGTLLVVLLLPLPPLPLLQQVTLVLVEDVTALIVGDLPHPGVLGAFRGLVDLLRGRGRGSLLAIELLSLHVPGVDGGEVRLVHLLLHVFPPGTVVLVLFGGDDLVDMVVIDPHACLLLGSHLLDSPFVTFLAEDVGVLESLNLPLFGRDRGALVLEDGLALVVLVVTHLDGLVLMVITGDLAVLSCPEDVMALDAVGHPLAAQLLSRPSREHRRLEGLIAFDAAQLFG